MLTLALALTFAIRDVRVFDGEKVLPKANVVVSGESIDAVGPDVPLPEGVEVIDGAGKTLLPGFIDSHTHVFADALERAVVFGVTTELDMFTSLEAIRKLKASDGVDADFLTAGTAVTVPGGHGSQYFPIPTFRPGSDAQMFIDARIAEGSDYIKLIYESGEGYGKNVPTLSKEDLAALIAATHKRGKKALVHVSTEKNARAAIEAGADGLVHIFGAAPPSEDFGKFAAQHDVFVVPTLTIVESASGRASGASLVDDGRIRPWLIGADIDNLKLSFPAREDSSGELANASAVVKQLARAGVPILAGTDSPNPGTAHGASMHRELELLVKAGLSPREALAAATSIPAGAFGLPDRGRIEQGKRADLVLVNGDPSEDIFATRDIAAVWKDGTRVERTRAGNSPAAAVEAGLISNFDTDEPAVAFGDGWQISTDVIIGGKSAAAMAVVGGSLRVTTETNLGTMFPWAGAMVVFGSRPMLPVDLSSKSGLSFRARGDSEIRLMAFAKSTGRIPRVKTVQAGSDWTDIVVKWSDFGLDGSDIQAILFAGPAAGTATFAIDDVRLTEVSVVNPSSPAGGPSKRPD